MRAAEAGEDGLYREGALHCGDDPEAAATAGTGENIEVEHSAHQGSPRPRAPVPAARGLAAPTSCAVGSGSGRR